MQPEEEKLVAMITLFLVCITSVLVNLSSLIVISRNSRVSPAVRKYFTTDSIVRITHSSITIFFTTPCAFTFFCDYEDYFTVGFLFNRILGYAKYVLVFTTHFVDLSLAINRFLAVFNGGHYYRLATSKVQLQSILQVMIPMIVFAPLLLPEQGNYFDAYTYGWWNYGDIATISISEIYHNSAIVIWILIICMDSITAFTIKFRTAKSVTINLGRFDILIMKQVFTLHSTELLYFIALRVFYIFEVYNVMTDFGNFWFYDFIHAMINVIAGTFFKMEEIPVLEHPQQQLIATIILFLVSLLGICFNCVSIFVVTRNNKVSHSVRILFSIDSFVRIIHCSISDFYTTPCAFTFFCIVNDSIGLLSNKILGYINFVVIYSTHFVALSLALNRFFAVFREGKYFEWISSKIYTQSAAIVVIPVVVLCPLLLHEQINYYNPEDFGWWHEGDIAFFLIDHIYHNSIIVIWIIVIVLDVHTAVTIRIRMARTGRRKMKKVDMQIMKQVFSFHLIELSYFIAIRILDNLQQELAWSSFANFWFYEFTAAMIDVLAGLTRVYYFGSLKPRKQTNSSDTQALSIIHPPEISSSRRTTNILPKIG